jgi:hypothetical protein
MLALKGLFSRPVIFNKMSRIFELQSRISFVSAWTQHYMPVTNDWDYDANCHHFRFGTYKISSASFLLYRGTYKLI